ncbi:MAG: methyltransferase domain-containing protein [Methanomicrobiales archaeon]|nr:methyltransferase domain-containing protein [Methanomicrobiales archaeon]
MQQDTNVKNWISCWKSSRGGSPDPMSRLGSVELWNERADNFAKVLDPKKKQKRMDGIFSILDEAGFEAKGSRVLDIGCGPGAISIPLARAGAHVTGLDISYKALGYLKANAEREGLSVDTVESHWWTADIDTLDLRNKFDLVVVSATPSVRDHETFERMIACSRKFCYYSHFLPGGRGEARDEALTKILSKDKSPRPSRGGMSGFMYNFMYLYLNGYHPIVRINHTKKKTSVEWEKAAERTIRSLEQKGKCTAATRKEVRDYYRTSAVDGKYNSVSEGYSGMMVWNVSK